MIRKYDDIEGASSVFCPGTLAIHMNREPALLRSTSTVKTLVTSPYPVKSILNNITAR